MPLSSGTLTQGILEPAPLTHGFLTCLPWAPGFPSTEYSRLEGGPGAGPGLVPSGVATAQGSEDPERETGRC